MARKIKLSIVVPCHNEEKNIPLILSRFAKAINRSKIRKSVELIFVDNNSNDNTAAVLRKLLGQKRYSFAKATFEATPGYGKAVYAGLKYANGEFLCWTHGDIQTDPNDALNAYNIIMQEKNPSKSYIKGRRCGRPVFDVFFSIGMSFFESLLFGTGFWEINAQPNLFHRSFFNKILNAPTDFSFDLYTYYLVKKYKYKLIRFPVFFGSRIHGVSSWNYSFVSKLKFIRRTIVFSFKLRNRLN